MRIASSTNQPVVENINRLIREKGLKQLYVAKKAGITEQAFSEMLNHRRIIRMCDVVGIAQALEVQPNDLFMEVEE